MLQNVLKIKILNILMKIWSSTFDKRRNQRRSRTRIIKAIKNSNKVVHNVGRLGCFWSILNFSPIFLQFLLRLLFMADRPGSLESVARVSNGRHPRLMSCDECPRWTRSPSSSSLLLLCSPTSSYFSSPRFYVPLSFVPGFAFASLFLPSILRSFVALHPAFSHKRENPVWRRTRLSRSSRAPTENWKHPIGLLLPRPR